MHSIRNALPSCVRFGNHKAEPILLPSSADGNQEREVPESQAGCYQTRQRLECDQQHKAHEPEKATGRPGALGLVRRVDAFPTHRSGAGYWRRSLRLTAIILCLISGQHVAAQEIGRLYAPRPPAGYAFVRVVAGDAALPSRIKLDAAAVPIDGNSVASPYRAVRADQAITITVDGSVLPERILPAGDKFSTVVVAREGAGWTSYLIDEGQGTSNDLKAQLRFFNLVATCDATLKVANGPIVFDTTAFKSVRSRAINPVQARLEASCGGRSASYELPQLRSGDHVSLFLRETVGGLGLSGQFDETEPYREQ